jgi:hypothetical protein
VPEEALVPQGGKQFVFKVVPDGKGRQQAAALEAKLGMRLAARSNCWRAWQPATASSPPARPACAQRRPPVRVVDLGKPPGRAARAPGQRASGQRRARATGLTGPQEERMRLSETSIRRPVLATVMSLLIVLIGAGVVQPPVGARVPPHRRAGGHRQHPAGGRLQRGDRVAGHQAAGRLHRRHRRAWTSSPRSRAPEQSQITVRFKLERTRTTPRPTCATASRGCARLPDRVDEPVIAKVEADATPTIWLAYTSETHEPLEVTDLINRIVKPRLQTAPGAADVRSAASASFDAHLARPPTSWPPTG